MGCLVCLACRGRSSAISTRGTDGGDRLDAASAALDTGLGQPAGGASPWPSSVSPALALRLANSTVVLSESRIAAARLELGDATRAEVVDGVFVLLGPSPSPLFDPAVRLTRQALAAYFSGRFAKRPDRPVAVYLFSSTAAYERYCVRRFGSACGQSFGLYRPETREIVLDASLGLTTLTHELVHPIVQADFPEAPAWINEGLGALFENPVFPRPGEIHGKTNWRHARLARALASKGERSEVTLEALFAMDDAQFRGKDADLHYAMAREACQWLDERGELWPFYGAWRSDVAQDPTGEQAFQRTLGKTPAEASPEWVRWVHAR
jgi:hypothetical protein